MDIFADPAWQTGPVPPRFLPRRLSRATASLYRALSRRRVPITLHGLQFRLAPSRPAAPGAVRFGITIGAAQGVATVPPATLARLLAPLDPAAAHAAGEALALLLELALEAELTTLEHLTGLPLALTTAAAMPEDPVALGLACDPGDLHIRVDLAPAAAASLQSAIESLPLHRDPLPSLAVPLRARLLTAELSLAELRRATAGDFIPADPPGPPPPAGIAALLVAGERYAWRAILEGAQLHLATPRLDAAATGLGGWMMTDDPETTPVPLDELPIRLAFDIGRLELPLAELETLGPGHVFELGRDPAAPVDILAAGRRIGRGEIVTIGETLGVRVLWIGRHDTNRPNC